MHFCTVKFEPENKRIFPACYGGVNGREIRGERIGNAAETFKNFQSGSANMPPVEKENEIATLFKYPGTLTIPDHNLTLQQINPHKTETK